MRKFSSFKESTQRIVIKKPWGVEIKDYKAGDPIPAGVKFKIFDANDTAKIDAYADSLDESADYQKKRFKEPSYMYESFEVTDGGNGKSYYKAETQQEAEDWAKENVNVLHRPLKVISGFKIYKKFEPRTIVKESVEKKSDYLKIVDRFRKDINKEIDKIENIVEKGKLVEGNDRSEATVLATRFDAEMLRYNLAIQNKVLTEGYRVIFPTGSSEKLKTKESKKITESEETKSEYLKYLDQFDKDINKYIDSMRKDIKAGKAILIPEVCEALSTAFVGALNRYNNAVKTKTLTESVHISNEDDLYYWMVDYMKKNGKKGSTSLQFITDNGNSIIISWDMKAYNGIGIDGKKMNMGEFCHQRMKGVGIQDILEVDMDTGKFKPVKEEVIVIHHPWGEEIKDYKAGDPIPAGVKFKIFKTNDQKAIDAWIDSLYESTKKLNEEQQQKTTMAKLKKGDHFHLFPTAQTFYEVIDVDNTTVYARETTDKSGFDTFLRNSNSAWVVTESTKKLNEGYLITAPSIEGKTAYVRNKEGKGTTFNKDEAFVFDSENDAKATLDQMKKAGYYVDKAQVIKESLSSKTHKFKPEELKVGKRVIDKVGGSEIHGKITVNHHDLYKDNPYTQDKKGSTVVTITTDKGRSYDVDANDNGGEFILESAYYVKRGKKYFCNLDGSPAWGPIKDLAIKFASEKDASDYMKNIDYLLNDDGDIKIVKESKKVVENNMVGIISLPVGSKFIDDSFGGKRIMEVVKHGDDDVVYVREVGTGRKFAYDASTPGGNKKVEKIEEGRIAKGYENLNPEERAKHLLSHPSSKYMNDLKSENITERAIRKAVKEMLGKPDKRDPQFIIDVNEDCIKESAFYVKFSQDGESSKYYVYNNGKHGFTDDKSKATKFSTKEEAEKSFKKNPYYDAFNMKYFDIVSEEGEAPAVATSTANVANPELPLKLKESNSWTMGNGDKIEVKSDVIIRTTKDGEKFMMPRKEWEMGEYLNPVPNWRKMKEDLESDKAEALADYKKAKAEYLANQSDENWKKFSDAKVKCMQLGCRI